MAHKNQQTLLNELKDARVQSGLTQSQLAKKTGVPRTTISKIEAGFRNTTLKTLLDLSKAVNLDLQLVKQNLLSSAKKLERNLETLNLIKISRAKILFNYDYFVNKFPQHQIWPVLKANAYGHGLTQIAEILQARNPHYLIVDSYYEALTIWKVSPQQQVLLIGATLPENYQSLNLEKTTLVIYNLEALVALGKLNRPVKIHLKVNTGMNRQGLNPNQIAEFCRNLKQFPLLELEGIMSHLADADNPDPAYTRRQEKLFAEAIALVEHQGFKPQFRHLDATAGSVVTKKSTTNAIRLGIGLYGYNPLPSDHPRYAQLKSLQPALSFTTKLVNILEVPAGEKVSYNGLYITDQETTIGVLPVGYFDFYDRKLSNQAQVRIGSHFFPLVGRICMNMVLVDLQNSPVNLFDQVEVINQNTVSPNSIHNISYLSGTTDYETLVRINQDTRREVV